MSLENLRALYVGPECNLTKQLGKLYAYVAIAIIFSSLMPILFLFLLLYAVLAHAVDKFAFLRIYRTPPPFSHTYISETLWWVQWALALKLLMGWWAFWQMPGVSISDAVQSVSEFASSAASGLGADDLADTLAQGNASLEEDSVAELLTGGWLNTAPQALFLAGMLLVASLIILFWLLRRIPYHCGCLQIRTCLFSLSHRIEDASC